MSASKKPPFKRGEWVTNGSDLYYKARLFLQIDAFSMRADPSYGSGYSIKGIDAFYFRRASARELRAEAKRLESRANDLRAGADAMDLRKKSGV